MPARQVDNVRTKKFALVSIIVYSSTVKLDLSHSEKSSLELSLILLEDDKLGLSLLNISEFVEILDVLLTSAEEVSNINKLTKFEISGENSSQKFFRSVKKVNKLECSKICMYALKYIYVSTMSGKNPPGKKLP